MKRLVFYLFFSAFLLTSCSKNKPANFYHWKAKATMNSTYEQALSTANTETIYLHYFDVKKTDNNAYPTYVIKTIDEQYKDYNIVPVVFITNNVFSLDRLDINTFATRIEELINEISTKHFGKKINTIQIDCDWNNSTKNSYFKLLDYLSNRFDVSATIRLHQIKYKDETGVPPLQKGTLMLYNVGDLKNTKENSILENRIVEQYINKESNYPLELSVGLPLFSQTIVFNNNDNIKIIKDCEPKVLANDSHFKQIDNNLFSVVKDTLYKGFYLQKDFRLKVEELSEEEVINSYKTIKNSALNTNEVIFYLLDKNTLNNINLNTIVSAL